MEMKSHSLLRIQQRTNLVPADVRAIIEADAVISLGSNDGREYLLFYSPPDEACRVAICTRDRKVLVSIWETRFTFPPPIKPPTNEQEQEAKKRITGELQRKLWRYTYEPDSVRTEVEIWVKGERVHQQFVGTIPRRYAVRSDRWGSILRLLRPFSAVVEATTSERKAIRYDLFFYTRASRALVASRSLTQRGLVRLLKAAS